MVGWSDPEAPVVTIQQPSRGSCPDQRWQVYPGGFVYSRPQCLRLEVEVTRQRSAVPFGLGKAC
jgi:hypothetical protein